jgi:CubicO group peptidase (beta-lactamase class C family)
MVHATTAGGLSEPRLARLREVMAGHIERGAVPGLVGVVARRGEVHVVALGTNDPGGSAPPSRDAIFRISSLTKPITAVATLILVERGLLRLDEPVDRLLPELAGRRVVRRLDGPLDDTVPAQRAITTRDLLTFTLGFGLLMARPGDLPLLDAALGLGVAVGPPQPDSVPEPDEYLRRLGSLPLACQPGERWLYSTGSDVLGVLIARAAGVPFEQFLHDEIFGPLGMVDTAFSVPGAKLGRLGACYGTDPATGAAAVYDPSEGQWSRPPAFPSGAGGLASTADDYLRFAQMLLEHGRAHGGGGGRSGGSAGGGDRILSRPAVELMTSDRLTPEQKARGALLPGYFDAHGWGFGVMVDTRRDDLASAPGRYGWDGGMGTAWRTDPHEEMITILMTPRLWESPDPPLVCRDFWTLAAQAIDD